MPSDHARVPRWLALTLGMLLTVRSWAMLFGFYHARTYYCHSLHSPCPHRPASPALLIPPELVSFLVVLLPNLLPKNKCICQHATGHTNHPSGQWLPSLLCFTLIASGPPFSILQEAQLRLLPTGERSPEVQGTSLTMGLTGNLPKCVFHARTSQWSIYIYFKVHLPYPQKLIACVISEKSWSYQMNIHSYLVVWHMHS